MAINFDKLSKQQLLAQIRLLQTHNNPSYSDPENKENILHELQVHQIELEMQNRELREAQQQLEETRDNYADLYDFAPVNYFSFDEKGLIKNINLTGASMLGKMRANITGLAFTKWLEKDSVLIFRKHLHKTFKSETKITDELKIKNEAGELLDVRIESMRSIDSTRSDSESTKDLECRSVILDITESNCIKNKLFLQARQLKLITDALPVLIAYIDENEDHLFANKIYSSSFEVAPEKVIGRSASEVWGLQTYKEIKKFLKLALAGQLVSFEMELPLSDVNKKYFHTTLIPDNDGVTQTYGVIVLIGDITDRLAIESIDRNRLLEIAHITRLSTMGEMTTEIAHELNQPLAAISIYSDACRRMIITGNEQQSKIIECLSDISIQAERASDVIRRIREFISKKDLHPAKHAINRIIEEALELLKVEIRTHNVRLKLNLAENIPEILIDKILIEQVIFNLVRNALEAMDDIDESRRLLIIESSSSHFNEIQISVDDAGPGLSTATIKQIFEPFITTKTDGMGMGLTISHSIIEAHHGRIWATQNEHGGTTFTFTLQQLLSEEKNAT